MDALGSCLIVGGVAFLLSGLLFLLPTERKLSSSRESFEENLERTEYYLQQMREDRHEL